jgi:hypothetical protein
MDPLDRHDGKADVDRLTAHTVRIARSRTLGIAPGPEVAAPTPTRPENMA